MSWDVTATTGAKLIINGSEISLSVGDNFKDAVIAAAKDAGYSKFRVILNGSEIDPADCPTLVSDNDVIEIMPYDKPAA